MQQPQRKITISRKAFNAIVRFEVGSFTYYQQHLTHPIWPNGVSGITIGIGYDLGYHTAEQFKSDWKWRIAPEHIKLLLSAIGLRGLDAKNIIDKVKPAFIPYDASMDVFRICSLPAYAGKTTDIYPGVESLLPDAAGGLISLVYNRGNSLTDNLNDKRQSRKEMRELVPLVQAHDYKEIADKVREMKRLWDGKDDVKISGLLQRRDEEADLIQYARNIYEKNELIDIIL